MVNTHMTIGILAHVDAGKTTLSEAMLYNTGKIRSLGRVDHQDAYLDNDAQERERGITIFSKQARFVLLDFFFYLCYTLARAFMQSDFPVFLRVSGLVRELPSIKNQVSQNFHQRRLENECKKTDHRL